MYGWQAQGMQELHSPVGRCGEEVVRLHRAGCLLARPGSSESQL
jgi:hypothetical protein